MSCPSTHYAAEANKRTRIGWSITQNQSKDSRNSCKKPRTTAEEGETGIITTCSITVYLSHILRAIPGIIAGSG
jgi:hypothetical protein